MSMIGVVSEWLVCLWLWLDYRDVVCLCVVLFVYGVERCLWWDFFSAGGCHCLCGDMKSLLG